MKALVLAAGVGQRLRPLTETIPKPLLEVGGRPLIHYPLLMLKRAGIRRIAINTHHLARAMESALGSGAGLGIEIVWAPEPVLLGTGGPLNALSGFLRDDAFVIANSDTILDLDLSDAIRFHRDRGALATLVIARPDNLEYYSRIEVDPEARVRRMRLLKSRAPRDYDDIPPEPPRDSRLESFMYCGAMIFEPQVLDLIPASPPWSLMTGLVGPMVREGLPVFGYPYRGLMRTIDDLDSYHRVHAEFETAPPRLSYLNRVV
jgi:NDP-sugar pyrophosphorylase family protein